MVSNTQRLMELRDIGKTYGAGAVLDGVDLDVHAGQAIGILGGNGAGKSTLLRIVAGLSQPSSGTVSAQLRTGYLPDRFPAALRMSVLAYLRHLGVVRGLRRAEATRRARYWLDRLALSAAAGPGTPLRQLSKGNAQKVGLAQALLGDPELLVLDEPWSGLDREVQGVLAEIVDELVAAGCAVVFSDHRESLVHEHATQALRLAGGRLHPLPKRRGKAAVVVLTGGTGDWQDEPGVLAVHADGDRVRLTVRPEYCDGLLLDALRAGWSVRAVVVAGQGTSEPGPSGAAPGPSEVGP